MGCPPFPPPREVKEKGGVSLLLRVLSLTLEDEGDRVREEAEKYRHTVGTALLGYERKGVRILDRKVTSRGVLVRARVFFKDVNAALV